MKNYIGSIVTIFYLLSYLVGGPWNSKIDLLFSGLLLFLIGIPHGAGDHLIAKKIADRAHSSFHLSSFILYYLGIMVLYSAIWYFMPNFAFYIFIGISVFHFGDMENLSKLNPEKSIIQLFRIFFLGSGILSFILFSHWNEVTIVIHQMNVSVPKTLPKSLIYLSILFLILGFEKKNYKVFINTLITLIAGNFIPLIPAFICYFSGCHAVYSFWGMKKHLNLKIFELYKKLLPFSLGAVFIGYIYINLIYKDLYIYPLFIFLSLLTLPHFLLMHKLIKRPN